MKMTFAQEAQEAMARTAYVQKREAMREGRIQRAATFDDRRKQASRKACRRKYDKGYEG